MWNSFSLDYYFFYFYIYFKSTLSRIFLNKLYHSVIPNPSFTEVSLRDIYFINLKNKSNTYPVFLGVFKQAE